MTPMEIIAAMSIPSAVTGFCFWLIERRIQRREEKDKQERERIQKEAEKRDEARRKNEVIIIESVNAAIALGEATARAVQRIPDAHCNGDMHAALDYAAEIKHKHKDFITEQGVQALY